MTNVEYDRQADYERGWRYSMTAIYGNGYEYSIWPERPGKTWGVWIGTAKHTRNGLMTRSLIGWRVVAGNIVGESTTQRGAVMQCAYAMDAAESHAD